MVIDLSLGESICFRPAAGRGTYPSVKFINCELATFLKRFCNEVHSLSIGINRKSTMFLRVNLLNSGDAVIAAAICSLQ